MSASSSSLESLIHSIIPQSRNDHVVFNDIIAHCKDVLSSHKGQNRERDIGHLVDLVKRRLAQNRPDGTSSVQFTNLLSRLLEQVHFPSGILYWNTLVPSFLPSLAPSPPITYKHTPTVSPVDAASPPQLKKGQSKAEVLREVRARSGYPHIPELALLRDALYLLQGISGKHIRFATGKERVGELSLLFTEDHGYCITAPTKQLIYRLSEVGHLYILVDRFIRDREARSGIGMIEQSLCHHLQSQLTEYYRLIAILESHLNISSNAQAQDTRHSLSTVSPEPNVRLEESGLTLKRLDVWINEWRLRMRMMSVCVEAAKDTHGGALVNLIHSYTENGDPFVRKFTDQLLEEVSQPFFETLQKWLFSGELYDPYLEFFVTVDPELAHLQYVHPSSIATSAGVMTGDGGFSGVNIDQDDLTGERESGLRLWQAKYKFRQEMLPAFVGEGFGSKIFSTGKSLNFIRYSCHDTDWIATREKMSNTNGTLQYSDIFGLERSIDAAYRIASQRLFDIFFDKFRLLDHLRALKNYLLLGHGDFADQLMETIGPSLSKPANSLYRHNLTATLETAIRSSNAQKDPSDVLRRLDARMLEYSQGEIGWDVFTLEYKVDAPLDTVLDPDSMVKYLKLFNHLWKMKRIESTMTKGWVRTASATKTFIRICELEPQWHKIRLITAEMIHFIRQMAAYCHLEVIECSWKTLMDFINEKEGDLDALISAHRVYLDRMVKKILLIGPKAGREENLLNQVKEAFSLILGFYDATEHFYNLCMTESSRRDSERDQIRGIYTVTDKHAGPQQSEALLSSLRQCTEYGATFSEKVQVILQGLQAHADLDCRFLGVRLSFSDFYRSKKDPQVQSKS
ncbi:gamma-tubulin complex DGRIP91/SPC98 component [Multifurca ochricompacta]|uniref:Gamma-tubulin complex DGRIP91/SPC98 component n=1 Tax=Multifurca ochricompacta TaxID=376703 RepID=A0AAD4MDC6_9AGAM|nr:gamma-tubulin complex DGRIP91/SPC98 component [Multifurca ochricompacta]